MHFHKIEPRLAYAASALAVLALAACGPARQATPQSTTPEVAVIGASGQVLYRGRIDNLYAALGKKRPEATEKDLRRALDEVLSGSRVSTPETKAIGCYIPPIGVK